MCLCDPVVPPTSDASERALRNSVVHRKVAGGFCSDWSAEAYAVATVLDTARKRGQEALASLHAAPGSPLAPPDIYRGDAGVGSRTTIQGANP